LAAGASGKAGCDTGATKSIRLLDSFNDPEDIPLLKTFLNHPSVQLNTHSGTHGSLYYSARATAIEALERRKIEVPDSVITKIEIIPPPAARDFRGDFVRYVLKHDLIIMLSSALVSIGACICLLRLKHVIEKNKLLIHQMMR
jgi:hypothetical protein